LLREDGNTLEILVHVQNAAGSNGRADFGRTSPFQVKTAQRSREINRGCPEGSVTAQPGGRDRGIPRPDGPRCGDWSPGCGPQSSGA
jgi:hypothetical protein